MNYTLIQFVINVLPFEDEHIIPLKSKNVNAYVYFNGSKYAYVY
jgi:hypothetical protein